MQVDDNLISSLEELSCLTLSDSDKGRLTADLKPILDCMIRVSEVNTDGVPECVSPLDNVNIFRDDKALLSYDRELILKNAPVKNNEFFIAPKTVD